MADWPKGGAYSTQKAHFPTYNNFNITVLVVEVLLTTGTSGYNAVRRQTVHPTSLVTYFVHFTDNRHKGA